MEEAFSNPLIFDEKEMRRSNILNEMLHGQYEDVFRRCFETRQLRPVCVDFSRVWLCLTGMKRSSYTQLGRMPYEQLELNQRYAGMILPQLDAMGLNAEMFMNVYSREKLLVFLLTPRGDAADVALAAQAINDVLQAMYDRELPGGGSPYFNFTVLSRKLNSFDEVAPAFESLSRLHALSFFEMRSASRTQEELERRAQCLDERALSEHIQAIKAALLSGDAQSRKGAQVLLYERLRDGADPETVRAVMRELRQMLERIIRVFGLPDDPAIEQTLDMARYSSIRALCDACFDLLDLYDRRIRRRDLPMGQITFKALEYIAGQGAAAHHGAQRRGDCAAGGLCQHHLLLHGVQKAGGRHRAGIPGEGGRAAGIRQRMKRGGNDDGSKANRADHRLHRGLGQLPCQDTRPAGRRPDSGRAQPGAP